MSRGTVEIDKKGPPMTQSKLGITPGEWHSVTKKLNARLIRVNPPDPSRITVVRWGDPKDEADVCICVGPDQEHNGKLIAEAGTVCNRTGLMPSELERQRDELRKALQFIADEAECPYLTRGNIKLYALAALAESHP